MLSIQLKFLISLLLSFNFNSAFTARILLVFPFPSVSQNAVAMPYIQALAARGHSLTVINALPQEANITNVKFITVKAILDKYNEFSDWETVISFSQWNKATVISEYFYNSSLFVMRDRGVQSLLHSSAEFDIVVVEPAYYDALYGFAQHFHAPLMGFSTWCTAWNIDYLLGNTAPAVYQPMSYENYAKPVTLLKRLQNWIYITEELLLQKYVYLPRQKEIYKKYFPHAAVPMMELRNNFSLILINQHFTVGRPRANVPNLIEIGGIHLTNRLEPLTADLARFIDTAPHGVIYFSMGVDILSTYLHKGALEILERTFASLKQRVIWKLEDISVLANKSDNIYIDAWLPQQAILAHSNVKLFMSHAGLLSTIESAYYGKPVLGLPMFSDQFGNIENLVKIGAGRKLDWSDFTESALKEAIHTLIEDPNYSENARLLAEKFRDQQMSPLETAIWWTEYVLRHKGALHMRVDSQDLAFFYYYGLDTMSVIIARLGITLLIVIMVAYKITHRICLALRLDLRIINIGTC